MTTTNGHLSTNPDARLIRNAILIGTILQLAMVLAGIVK
jgi:hypothetical protein